MRRLLPPLLVLAALLAPAPVAGAASPPTAGAMYKNGQDGRYLLGGTWLFRFDGGTGLKRHFERSRSSSGWSPVAVPNAWNATDQSTASFRGTAAWYRRDFTLPKSAAGSGWIVRFESVNYRSRVWLNGKPIGSHAGAYLPFELRLPGKLLKRGGVNRLVVRVDDRRTSADLPPSNENAQTGRLSGGWWNYGGLLREVYLRRVDQVDLPSVLVTTRLACDTCTTARVAVRADAQNVSSRTQRVTVRASVGGRRAVLGVRTLRAGATATLRRTITITGARLWSITTPTLYDVDVTATTASGGRQHFLQRTGLRSLHVVGGRLLLNGHPVNLRGVGIHEDSPTKGAAIDDNDREQQVQWARELGATMIRAHYPLHPYTEERADELGILLWSEIPMYSLKTKEVDRRSVRDFAGRMLRQNILVNGSHPSVAIWSIGNELSSKPDAGQRAYIRAQVSRAHALDPSRPVGIAVAGYPSAGCQSGYAPLQVIGLNDYFGWYPGPSGQIADRTLLSDYLDRAHACYANKALFVTEFGAEANRDGPAEERGTYQFQQDFVNYQLGVFATKPWLNGALYWTLQEFRVRPNWDGGNPHPLSPLHQKGLITFDGQRKPAFFDVQRDFRAQSPLR